MAAPLKLNRVQLFDHSYVRRLKDFIRESDNFTFTWDLQGPPPIQYSGFPGADLNRLRNNIDVIEDFDSDVLFLFAGTNNLFHYEVTPSELAGSDCRFRQVFVVFVENQESGSNIYYSSLPIFKNTISCKHGLVS